LKTSPSIICKAIFNKWKTNACTKFVTSWFSILENNGFLTLQYHDDQVVILPIVDFDSIILVKVHRPVIGTSTWELPAGGLEGTESPRNGALRELKEETGISIKVKSRLKPMNTLVVSPTRMPMFPNLFSIDISRQEFEQRQPHDDEIELVEAFSLGKIREMIIKEEIFVSLPLAILSRFLLSQEK